MDRRVLIVENNTSALETLGNTLTAGGWRVDAAATRADAEEFLGRSRYDLVITDLSLSGPHGGAGFELTARVQNTQASALMLLVIENSSESSAREARSVGVQMMLARPIALDEVARMAGRMLSASAEESTGTS